VRVVAGDAGSLILGRHLPGRGAWLCGDGTGRPVRKCLAEAERHRSFGRALRAQVAPGAVGALREAPGGDGAAGT
jgi:predicted RNA-binding protein YlxR (DUF448 family)